MSASPLRRFLLLVHVFLATSTSGALVFADDCGCTDLLSRNHSLEIQVRTLKEQVNSCNLLQEANLLRQQNQEAKQEHDDKKKKDAALLERFKQQLLADARSGNLPMEGYTKLLHGKSKQQVMGLLGRPPNFKVSATDEAGHDFWRYPGIVKLPESPTLKWDLLVKFTNGFVTSAYSKAPSH